MNVDFEIDAFVQLQRHAGRSFDPISSAPWIESSQRLLSLGTVLFYAGTPFGLLCISLAVATDRNARIAVVLELVALATVVTLLLTREAGLERSEDGATIGSNRTGQ